ncbi:MAG: hypothetical protein VXU42_06745, partial [Verrucomicrobiota bacterium]|nr:hypothetical protein [Verrucomicrobiota bacterium]
MIGIAHRACTLHVDEQGRGQGRLFLTPFPPEKTHTFFPGEGLSEKANAFSRRLFGILCCFLEKKSPLKSLELFHFKDR